MNDFVIHVGDIHDVVDFKAFELQEAADHIDEEEGAEVADMGEIINSWAATIEPYFFAGGLGRLEGLYPTRKSVKKL